MQDNSPRPLTVQEFEAMMNTLDEAQDWMLNELRQRQIGQEAPHVPVRPSSDVHKVSPPPGVD